MKSCQSQGDGYGIESTKAIMDCERLNKWSVLLVAGLKKMEMIRHGGLVPMFDKRNTFSAVFMVNNARYPLVSSRKPCKRAFRRHMWRVAQTLGWAFNASSPFDGDFAFSA
jgi:hypothetical protein